MKILKNILILFFGAILFNSCDNKLQEQDYLDGRKPYFEFQKEADNFFLKMDQENIYDIQLKLSQPASSNFDYTVSVDNASEATEGVDFNLMSTQLSVSEGEEFVYFTINGDFDNADVAGKKVIFHLSSSDSFQSGTKSTFELTLIKFCPIESDFTGTYILTQISGGLGGFFNQTPIWGDGTQVNIVNGSNDTERIFSASYYPALLSSPPQDISFSLICGETIMNSNTSTVSCDGGATPLDVSASTSGNSTYNPNDDTTFNIIFTENPAEGCGQTPVTTEIKFTKI